MIDVGLILDWLKRRRLRKKQEVALQTLIELNALTVTIHGRIALNSVIQDDDNGLPIEVRRMYYILLANAPVKDYAVLN